MTAITAIDRSATRILSNEAEEALKAVADKFGLKLVRGNSRYNPASVTVKFDFQVVSSNGVSKKAAQGAGLLGLPTDIVGRQFRSGRGGLYTVTDINLRRPKYPVSATGPQGGRYKFPVSQVLSGLVGGSSTAAPTPVKRPEADIIKDIQGVYCSLSPENLSGDGELSRTQIARRGAELNRRLRELQTELGRKVTEGEAFGYAR